MRLIITFSSIYNIIYDYVLIIKDPCNTKFVLPIVIVSHLCNSIYYNIRNLKKCCDLCFISYHYLNSNIH